VSGEEIFQVIGFLLEAKDLATPAVMQAQLALSIAAPKMEKMFSKTVSGIEGLVGGFGIGIKQLVKSFFGTITEATFIAPLDIAVAAFATFADGIAVKMEKAANAVVSFPGKMVKAFKALDNALFKEQRSFADFYRFLGTQTVNATKLITKGLVGGFAGLGRVIGNAGVMVGGFVRSLGPIGLLLKLFEPVIGMLTRALMPALETFTDILENAFAPLSFVAETIARDLAPLVAKFLQPFVNLLVVGLAKLGTFIVKLLDTGKASGALSGIFNKFQPIMERLLGVFGKLFEALVPLIEPLTKLGLVLLEKVFAPLLLKSIEGITLSLEVLLPMIEEGVPVIAKIIDDLAETVSDFYGNLDKYMGQFNVLFIDPIVDGLSDMLATVITTFTDVYDTVGSWVKKIGDLISSSWTHVSEGLGLNEMAKGAGKAFDAVLAAIQSPIATIKTFINENLIGVLDSLLGADLPLVGKLSNVLSKLPGITIKTPLPRLEKGGVVGPGTAFIAGEKGPELVTPLKREVFEAMLPGLDEAVDLLKSIHAALKGTLSVRVEGGVGGSRTSNTSASPASDLGAAVGLTGLAGV
jgi:hypothetical protein